MDKDDLNMTKEDAMKILSVAYLKNLKSAVETAGDIPDEETFIRAYTLGFSHGVVDAAAVMDMLYECPHGQDDCETCERKKDEFLREALCPAARELAEKIAVSLKAFLQHVGMGSSSPQDMLDTFKQIRKEEDNG